jgi:hypothetical protein
MIARLAVFYWGVQTKKYEVGRVGSMYGEEERWILGFGGENWRKQTSWKNHA